MLASSLRRSAHPLSLVLLAMLVVACPKTETATSGSAAPPEKGVVIERAGDATKVTIDGGFVYSVPDDLDTPLPWDDEVATGTLDNGMRWYVEKNVVPKDRVELWLAVRVGSVQEDDDQQGLAHLLEHMAFNGTTNFPGNSLITYLESVGTRFGAHLNAHTSFEETIYKLQVPTDDEELLGKGFTVLSDWAGGMLLNDEDIEGERGVVLEEWRRSRGAMGRTWDVTLPLRYFGAPHANRRPIGTEDSLKSFTPDAVRRFYADWYRPDLMAVVVVGDIEPADAERRIQEAFGGLAAPAEPRQRDKVTIPTHEDTLVGIVADPEQRFSSVGLVHKMAGEEVMSHQAYRDGIVTRLYTRVMRERLAEIVRNPESPLQRGFVSHRRMTPTTESQSVGGSAQGGKEREALEVLMLEVERARRFGVLESELERAKAGMLDSYRGSWVDRENQESRRVLGELIRNFTNGENVPGIGYEYAAASAWLPGITKAEVDAVAKAFLPEGSRVATVIRPGGELPALTEEDVLSTVAGVATADLEAPVDVVVPEALVANPPEPGTVVST
ncbi:MAG: insulinase family protein, partial [Deltaproteobacteria bacterium]|nr:insulinase family protein [Deltaproteobacteria bacterium]